MKKLILILTLVLSLFVMASCFAEQPETPDNGNDGGNNNGDGGNGSVEYTTIVSADSSLSLSSVISAISAKNGKMLFSVSDANVATKGEIVFGQTNRPISAEAMAKLDEIIAEAGDSYTYAGYLIYKNAEGNVAVCWSSVYAADFAIDAFVADYADLDLLNMMTEGVIYSNTFNLDDYIYDTTWGKLEEQATPEVFEALRTLKRMYNSDAIVEWMANLWEPYICVCGECDPEGEMSCYGGAFYYANSARDYQGFLPDMENTYFILNWMQANGALKSYAKALPDDIKAKLIKFTQSLQSEADGYFYHPQWGTNITTDRRGRDLRNATAVLEALGAKALYPTALDRLENKSVSALTKRLGISAAAAVSAVLATTDFEDSLGSAEEYMAWLIEVTGGEDMFEGSNGAHVINAVQGQIEAAGYLEITLDYLDSQQELLFTQMKEAYDINPVDNPEPTGLWQRTIDYNAVWGLLKLAPFYTAGNREIKYAEYAMKTCVGCIMIDADEGGNYHANDLMNQWSSANMLISNVKKHNPTVVEKLYEIARENAPAMIAESKAKIAKFIQADGTFGYNQGTSAPTTQGVPVSMGLPEGDVNATSLICTMYRCCFTVLGYSVVPLCDYRDGERFIETITSLGSAAGSKIPQAKGDPIDFEDESKPIGMNESFNNGRTEIVNDPYGKNGKVLYFDTTAHGSAGDSITFSHNSKNANCYVMEFDINVASFRGANAAGTIFQIRLGESFMLEVYHNNGKISLRANPTTKNNSYAESLNITFDLEEWASIRVEYYVDSANPTTKVFYNDTLTATTHSFYIGDASSPAGMSPMNLFSQARFFALRAVDATVYLDNFFFESTMDTYNDSTLPLDKK